MAANVIVNVISRANNSGFASASRALAKFSALATAATVGAASAAQAVSVLAVAGASLGALALPALGAVVAGLDGIKAAATTAQGSLAAFKGAMSSSFAGMSTGFGRLGGVLTSITPQMRGVGIAITGVFNGLAATVARNTGVLQALASKAAEFVTRLGPGLNTIVAKMIQFGSSINVDSIFNLFTQLWQLLGPIANLFVQLSQAAGPFGSTLGVLGGVITAITPSLVNIASTVGPALSQAFVNLAPAITQVAAAFASFVGAIAPALPPIASLVTALVSGLGPVLPVIVGALVMFGPIMKAVSIATTLWSAAMWVLNSALWANPITWVVIAIIALIAVVVLIATKTTWFQTIWQAMCTGAVAAWNWIVSVVSAFAGWVSGVWSAIVAGAVAAWTWVKNAAVSAWNGISAIVSAVAGVIGAVISGAINIVVGAFNRARAIAGGVFGGIRSVIDTVANAISTVVGWVHNLISAIANIHWPSAPGWLSKIFSGDPAGIGGLSAYMTPRWALQNPTTLQLAGGFPSSADLGALTAARAGTVNIDNRTIINVDGTGVADPQAVAAAVRTATRRDARTRGTMPAVRLGA